MSASRLLPKWPTLNLERDAGGVVCGVDEAGYAPIAGPVVAAAVILPTGPKPRKLRGLTDSKLLSAQERERFYELIHQIGRVGVGKADVDEIDRLNIFHADMLAMSRAVEALVVVPDRALIDGRACPPLGCPAIPVVKGDRRSLSIAAASVVAKVERDRIMRRLAVHHPAYGWMTNVGYGTDEHYLGLLRKGMTEHHRRSFAPLTTIFGPDGADVRRYRFLPLPTPPDLSAIELLRLRQDLYAVFEGGGFHVGTIKNFRGRWKFRAVGYDAGDAPAYGRGPFAERHGREIERPERQALLRILRS